MPLTEEPPVLIKRLNIGEWDMQTNQSVSVDHNLDYQKIDDVSVIIRNDSDAFKYKFETLNHNPVGGIHTVAITSTQIILERIASGFFDDPNFNLSGINRGRILIQYQP